MVKLKALPLRPEVRLPGGEKPLPKKGVEVEPTAYWRRLAEIRAVRLVATEGAGRRKGGASKGRGET